MKKLVLGLAVLVGTTVFWATPPCDNEVFAQSGCCKERDSLDSPWKRQRGVGLSECKRSNESDGDNVFDQSGLVWWDVRCR